MNTTCRAILCGLAVLLFMSTAIFAQKHNTPAMQPSKTVSKAPFVPSHFYWSWYQNGLTSFSFSLKNQSGSDVKWVKYRVLFFDRSGNQIEFVEGLSGPLPNGLAQRQSVDLGVDTGMSTRKLSVSQKVEILDFHEKEEAKEQPTN